MCKKEKRFLCTQMVQYKIELFGIQGTTVHGNIRPCFIFAPFALLVNGRIYIFLNITLSGRIQEKAKLFAGEEGRN